MSTNRNQEDVPESSGHRRQPQMPPPRRHNRHTPYQCQRLEEYFNQCRHPNKSTREEIGRETGLTPTQVKFWFQNKRTVIKEQTQKEEGKTLRIESNQLKSENNLLKHSFKEHQNSGWCTCGGTNPMAQELNGNGRQLRAENMEMRRQFSVECNVLANKGVPIPRNMTIEPPLIMHVPSTEQSSNGAFIGQTSRQSINQQLDLETTNMIQTLRLARDELMSLLHVNEPFWLKDKPDGRYIIHRDAYESTFSMSSTRDSRHLRGSQTRFESSKYEAFLCMSAFGVTEMLMDSKKRLDLFPTILTEAFTIQEYGNKIWPGQVGHLKLVYEQMHLLSPLAVPREVCYVRFCENIREGVWLIGEASLDFLTSRIQLNSPIRAWRLPSGCIIKDISPGVSQVKWMEHVEIDDRASIHLLYQDVFLRGLAFGADRWVEILSRSCHILDSYNNNPFNQFVSTQNYMGEVIGALTQDDKKCIISLTENIMKRFCMYMNMKNKLEIYQQRNTNGIRFSLCEGEEYAYSANGLVVNASTTFWLPAPCQMILDFLKDASLRAQWDVLCEGKPGKEVASISFGNQPDNSISMIQPFGEAEKNILLLQETLVDPLGAILVYAPIKMEDLNGELNGYSSSHILPSGFIISKDGNPDGSVNVGGASTSTNVEPMASGSVVTVAFQAASFSNSIDMEFVNIVTSLISSTVHSIKLAFDFPNSNV